MADEARRLLAMPAPSRTQARSRSPQRGSGQRGSAPSRPVRRPAPPVPLEGTPKPSLGLLVVLSLPVTLIVLGVVAAIAVAPVLAIVALLGVLLGLANFALGRPSHLLSLLGGGESTVEEDPRLFNVLEGLCVENGLPIPRVRILDDDAANSLLLPAEHGGLVLVCTRGLLDNLDRIELEAILADTLAGAKRGDVKRAALVAQALGATAALSSLGATLAWRFTDPARQFRTDREACRMTCFPPGLLSALEVVSKRPTEPAGLAPALARLSGPYWLVPLEIGKPRKIRVGELDLDLRISALAEL
jgi:Zn-dependent protease with chaperone function